MKRYALTKDAPSVRIIARWLEQNPASTVTQIAEGTGLGKAYVQCRCIPAMLTLELIHHCGYVRGTDGHPPRTFKIGPRPQGCNPRKPPPVNNSKEHRAQKSREYRQRNVDVRRALKRLQNTRIDPVLSALAGLA